MLTRDDKARLRFEEEFRYKVRKALEQGKSSLTLWDRICQIINSAFGIFFLSTVVIGLLSWSYTRWDIAQKTAAQQREAMRRLYIEIPYRIRNARRAMDLADWGPDQATRRVRAGLEQLKGTKSVFPEFEGRPLFLLLFELHSLVPEERRQEVYRAYEESLALYDVEPLFLAQQSEEEKKYEESSKKDYPSTWLRHVEKGLSARGQALENFDFHIWPELKKAEKWNTP